MFIHPRLAFALAIGAAMASFAAHAADNTRYISITGNNANTCTLAKPCRTLQGAIAKTPAGGEIRILDSGFYGPTVTIEKSLTISGNGNTVYLNGPIVIDKAGAVVRLRELMLDGQGTVVDGIRIIVANAVHIERCTIFGFTQDGIQAAFGPFEVFVVDTTSRNNGDNGLVIAGATTSKLAVDNSHFDNNGVNGAGLNVTVPFVTINRSTASGNGEGIRANSGTNVVIVSTVVSNNHHAGFFAGQGSKMMLESSTASGNNHGLRVSTGGIARIANSTFAGSGCCPIINSGIVETRGDNTIRANATDSISGNALTPFNKQ